VFTGMRIGCGEPGCQARNGRSRGAKSGERGGTLSDFVYNGVNTSDNAIWAGVIHVTLHSHSLCKRGLSEALLTEEVQQVELGVVGRPGWRKPVPEYGVFARES
jgi:hypothetical protein